MIEVKKAGLFDILEHKEGYRIEKVFMTTFSFEKALFLPIAYRLDEEPIDQDSLFSLENLCQQYPEKLRVFYQKNKLLGAKLNLRVAPLLEKALNIFGVMVEVDENICFHPKITLVFYRKKDIDVENKEVLLCRLAISSRNLTLGESKEAIVIIEKQLSKEKCVCLLKKEVILEDIITFVNKNFETAYFQSPADKEISIESFMEKNTGKYDCIDCISPGFEVDKVNGISVTPWWNKNSHAKVYIFSKKDDLGCRIWVGSANCTYNGLHRNYECITYFDVPYSRDQIIHLLREAEYDNSRPNYELDSDSNIGIDSLQREMGALQLKRQGKRYILKLANPINTNLQKGQAKLEVANQAFNLENNTQEYIIEHLQWIPKYVILGYSIKDTDKNVIQYRTLKISLSNELEKEYEEQLQETCKRNLQITSIFSTKKSRSLISGDDGKKRNAASSSKAIMHKDGEFEQIISIYHELGIEGLNKEQKRIRKYQESGLFDERRVSREDINTVLQMMEMLILTEKTDR